MSNLRIALLSGASLATLLVAQPGLAQTISGLRGTAATGAAAGARPGTGAPVTTLPPTAEAALTRQNALKARVATAMDLANQAQAAARTTALAKPSLVPNGLGAGGLLPAGTITADPSLWQNANAPTQVVGADGKTLVTIGQTAQKAILTWDSFNVGKDTIVHFDQAKGTQKDGSNEWIALNRINDPSLAPSQIQGQIKAEGSVYLINRNGILFSGTAQVNTHSLIVSAGDLFSGDVAASNKQFLAGGINDPTWQGAILGSQGQNTGMGAITVESGAQIETKERGFSIFFGQTVTNNGSIVSNGGQTLLAAGAGLVLNQNGGSGLLKPSLVGFMRDDDGMNLYGTVVNNGSVVGLRGDVTLLGVAIEQNGIALSTTGISQPGTVNILNQGSTSGGGTVILGVSSLTAILPDANGETTSSSDGANAVFKPGSATIAGGGIWFRKGSIVQMPGAALTVTGGGGPLIGPDADLVHGGRIYVDEGATISVAGLADVQRPMSDNLVTIPRVGQNELADSPLQRDGILYKSPFTVDARDKGARADGLSWVGSPVVNASGYSQAVPRSVNMMLTNGGTINFNLTGTTLASTGNVASLHDAGLIVAPSAAIDVSGGYLHYLGGSVATSRLIGADGRVYDASRADPNMTYVGFAGQTVVNHNRWGVTDNYSNALMAGSYESDYVQGGAGGALNIVAQSENTATGQVILDGALYAQAVIGRYQIGGGKEPLGGSLSITTPGLLLTKNGTGLADLGSGFGAGTSLVTADRLNQPVNDPTNLLATANLSTDMLSAAGFAAIKLTAATITASEGSALTVNPGGSISLAASRIDIGGNLTAHSGKISLVSDGGTGAGSVVFGGVPGNVVTYPQPENGSQPGAPTPGDITVGGKARLDVSGLWVNDTGAGLDTRVGDSFVNAGSISIATLPQIQRGYSLGTNGAVQITGAYDTTGAIILKPGSVLDASGGGYVDTLGRVETKNGIPVGKGGDISLATYGASGNAAGAFFIGDLFAQGRDPGEPLTHGIVQMGGTIDGFGFAGGGTLSLRTLGLQIGGDATGLPAYVTWLPGGWFADQGFGGYSLNALYDATIAPGTKVTVSQRNYTADLKALALLPSGANLGTSPVVALGVTDPFHRQATDFSLAGGGYLRWNALASGDFSGNPVPEFPGITGTTLLGAGAAILADARASVTLASYGQLTDLGAIVAHGGPVNLTANSNLSTNYDFMSRSVWLGAESLIDVSGMALTDPFAVPVKTADGVRAPRSGVVLDGGSVSVEGGNAYLVAEKGSRIDASGTVATLDIRGQSSSPYASTLWQPTAIASNGGTIQIGAGEGLYFDGTITARGGAASARGGTLIVADRPTVNPQFAPAASPAAVAAALIVQQSGDLVTADMRAGGRIESGAAPSQVMRFAVDRLGGSGIDTLILGGDPTAIARPDGYDAPLGTIAFAGNVNLSLDRAVMMNAASYVALPEGATSAPAQAAGNQAVGGGVVSIAAPYVLMAGGGLTDLSPVLAGGDAALNVKATQIDLMGQFQLQRFADATFTSSGDIRLLMPATLAYLANTTAARAGELVTAGDLTFKAAQLYPASGTVFVLDAPTAGSTVTFLGNGTVAPPLSVGGALLVDAANIVQQGTIRAPSGTIQLGVGDASDASVQAAFNKLPLVNTGSVTLGAGSLTSVSLDQRSLPYGTTTDGTDWKLIVQNSLGNTTTTANLTQAPQKLIGIAGARVDLATGATVDLSGGGNVYAQEFVPGTGGSRDLLAAVNKTYSSGAQPVSTPLYADHRQVYAVVPGNQAPLAAYDPSFGYSGGSGESQVGKSVYLSGVAGLPDGVYTLLPGQYATLLGAYRVVQETAISDSVRGDNVRLADGSNIVSGRFVDSLTGKQDARTTSFLVQSADAWKQYSNYTITGADDYFAKQANHAGTAATRTPIDAGRLALAATASLNLDGALKAQAGTASGGKLGRGSQVDISAQDIQVLGGAGQARSGYLQVDATQLSGLGAESLLIGGTRSDTAGGTAITATANSVILSNDAATALAAPEILLVAKAGRAATDPGAANGLLLESGSVITATGNIATASTAPIVIGAAGGASGDGALVRVSNGGPVSIIRNNVPGLGGVAGVASGLLDIRGGAVVNGGKSTTLDATGSLLLAPGATFSGDAVDVNANAVAFVGSGSTASPGGFVVDPGLLAQFAKIATLGLHSRSTMGFFGNVDLAVGQSLVLGAPVLASDGGNVTISAPKLVLANDVGTQQANFAAGSGRLILKADELDIGPGAVTVQGFGAVAATATKGIAGQGTGSLDFGTLDVTMTAPVFMADSAANTSIKTSGALRLARAQGAAIDRESLGGALAFTGGSIITDATIQALAGNLTLEATGGDLTLGDGARLSTAGINKTFFDTDAFAAGGALKLFADKGAIGVARTASLTFGGAAKGGDAGSLTVSAAGAVALAGALDGHVASNNYRGSTFTLASGAAVDLDGIADLIATSGITGGLSVTSGQGNLALSAGKTLKGQIVYLEANGGHGPSAADGNVIVNGTIDVSGQVAGHIDLYGQSGVDVEGRLLAVSSVAHQNGGAVTIGTAGVADGTLNGQYGYQNVQGVGSGSIHVGAGALIDVSGGSADSGGKLSFRAPLLADGGVNIAVDNPANIKGAASVTIEPYAVWSTADTGQGDKSKYFDGVIDPSGWYKADGTMVAGTWTDDQGKVLAAPAGGDQLKDYLSKYYFTPDTANADHTGFYNYLGGDPAKGPGTIMGYVQAPGYSFGNRYAGIANVALRPGIELRNPGSGVNGGNIDILTNWNLGAGVTGPSGGITLAYRYNGQAPILTVRAGHDLNIQASITDGFYQQNAGAHLQDPVAPPSSGDHLYADALAAYQVSKDFIDDNSAYWNGTIKLMVGSTSQGMTPGGGTRDVSADPYYTQLAAPLADQTDAYYGNYMLYITEFGDGSSPNATPNGGFIYRFVTANSGRGFLAYNPTSLVAPQPADYASYDDYLSAYYDGWLRKNFATNPIPKRVQTPSPVLSPIAQDYDAYSADYAKYATIGYDQYYKYVSSSVGNFRSGVQLFYAPFAPRANPAGSKAYQDALAAYQVSKAYVDSNPASWNGTINLKDGNAAQGMTPGGGTRDITADPYYTPLIAPLTKQSDAYYANYMLYITEFGNGMNPNAGPGGGFIYNYTSVNNLDEGPGFLAYNSTTLVAPQPANYATYDDYLTAYYDGWLTKNFSTSPVARRKQTPSPVLLPIAQDYGAYSADYAKYATIGYDQYYQYVSNSVGNPNFGSQLFYAPFAPRGQADTGGGTGGGSKVLPVAPSAANNTPSNMPIAGSPASLASATLLAGPSTSYRLVAGADFGSADPLVPALAAGGSVNVTGHFGVVNSATTDDKGNPIDPKDPLFGKTIVFPTVIRTGTGSIDVAASGDIVMADQFAPAAIYTAGEPVPGAPDAGTGVQVFRSAMPDLAVDRNTPDFLITPAVQSDRGGDITLKAAGDIRGNQQLYDVDGSITKNKNAYIAQSWWAWLSTGNVTDISGLPIASSINFGNFDQGVLSAGGNVTVKAGGDIDQLQVSLPTTWYLTGDGPRATQTPQIVGGGNLAVNAGGDISGGSYFVSRGTGDIRAGGQVGSAFTLVNGSYGPMPYATPVSPLLGLQDAQVSLVARGDVNIGGVYNPSWTGSRSGLALDSQSYSAASAVHLASTVGDIDFDTLNIAESLFAYGRSVQQQYETPLVQDGFMLPATLTMTAFNGGISIGGTGQLYPSASGQLSLIANRDIDLVYGWSTLPRGTKGFGLTDVKASLLPSILSPVTKGTQWDYLTAGTDPAVATQARDLLLHQNDARPMIVYSLTGDIVGGHREAVNPDLLGLQTNALQLISVKPARIEAGRDIVNLTFRGQNFFDSDVTSIVAGRDIYDVPGIAVSFLTMAYPTYIQVGEVQLGGPGTLDLQAGRDFGPVHGNQPDANLTPTTGFQTVGNLYNPLLPRSGANISLLFGTGSGVAWDAFAKAYLDPSAPPSGLPSFSQYLIDGVTQYQADLDRRAGGGGRAPTLTADQAWAMFGAMPQTQRQAIIQKVFFKILTVTSADENDPNSPNFGKYARGYQAIETLFPAALGYTRNNLEGGANGAATQVATGNLDIRGSTIQTQQGGDITIMGPGGRLLIGSTASPPFVPAVGTSGGIGPQSQGVLAWEKGAIDIFSDQSLLLAQSRIFTERGGDMTLWSSNGDINAGQGVKTSSEIKPVSYLCSADDYCRINGASAVTGAGIAAFPAAPGDPAPTVTLAAPRGTVDFGDAGVRVAGNLIVAAQAVANADNVQVSGLAIGVPTNQVNVSANLAASSTAANAAQEAATAMQQARENDRPSYVIITIDSFGTEPQY